jgi:transcriptional regulator GlxA family with amidase domain
VRTIGIFIFDEVEVLDFAGPFEVFSTAARVTGSETPAFRVITIGESNDAIRTRGGLRVDASFSLADHPELEVLIVPGGVVDAQLDRAGTISWIAAQSKTTEVVASVCTGAFLLGKAGLLNGKRATTHWEDLGGLRELLPDTRVIENRRWIDEGAVITSAGISAGIDMSLHLVARLAGRPLAEKTARQMDYEWKDS